ncbi:hypothetical protein SCP_0407340 [Sparassis crispa]|uniref:Zn(2)-C6 fungal-type domain-containing protein n=1 Tax=Sparassis crispa TaxID=139825 RepID=A0A401GJL7_9APHY|nr:hypothetical protein SCP_0407340 [Sparassis crispa]GBE82350.1 hypothetical protein SCP_0407340 [Sparassis crispa]
MPGQPKSSRQQYSACGACRMRRVRCDLKDLPISASGQHPPCSNCSERGLKCVDEFAEVKAVKLLRRGRRLQQVEAVYGQNASEDSSLHSVSAPQSVIPGLKDEFFSSPFFHRLHIQRPIIEPMEFCPRFFEFSKGNKDALQVPGQLIALLLVIWAASFGVNEYGVEEVCDGPVNLRRRRDIVNEMLLEVLYLVDIHGILRKPTWDGVRALLLILPLTQEVQSPVERMAMHEATISQVYTLCSLASVSSVSSGQGDYVDALVRARVFWYTYVLDGVTSALRGGRILLTDDDLSSFEATLPPLGDNSGTSACYAFSYRYATIPIRIASACRQLHSALTGPKARQRNNVDEDKLQSVWQTLDQCWKDFDGLRQFGTAGFVQSEDVERFIDGWQVFIFECHNVIREALKQRLTRPAPDLSLIPEAHRAMRAREYEVLGRVHDKASHRCQIIVRDVVSILRRNIGQQLFKYDAALIRDGCFFAGFLLAGESGNGEDIETCLHALNEMHWAFSKSEEREQTVRMVWEARLSQSRPSTRGFGYSPTNDAMRPSTSEAPYSRRPTLRPLSVPPLSLNSFPGSLGSISAPSTACSTDGNWPSTISTTSSGTDPYRSYPSTANRSPPYVPAHNGLVLDTALPPKHDLIASPTYVLSSTGLSAGRTNETDSEQVFFFTPYSYMGMGDTQGPHQSAILPAATSSHSPTFSSSQFFDAAGVVFPNGTIAHSGSGTGNMSTTSAGNSGSRHIGGGDFYH